MAEIKITKDEVVEISQDTTVSVTAPAHITFNVTKDAELTLKLAKDIDVTKVTHFTGKVSKYKEVLVLEQGATLNNNMINVGKDNFDVNIDAKLSNAHTTVNFYLVDLAAKSAVKKWFINAQNIGKSTTHDVTHYTLALDKSNVTVLCNAEMFEGCNGSANTQLLKAIMFSDDAAATVDPMLIIDEPDLEDAGHGATIGKLDEEQLYYLRSRGISEKEAVKLIIDGFFRPIYDEVKDIKLLESIKGSIDSHLKG